MPLFVSVHFEALRLRQSVGFNFEEMRLFFSVKMFSCKTINRYSRRKRRRIIKVYSVFACLWQDQSFWFVNNPWKPFYRCSWFHFWLSWVIAQVVQGNLRYVRRVHVLILSYYHVWRRDLIKLVYWPWRIVWKGVLRNRKVLRRVVWRLVIVWNWVLLYVC